MKEYRKKNYVISAEIVEPGTKLYNFLEDCHYVTNDMKCVRLIGTVGEEWPVTVEKLKKTYTFPNGLPITDETIPLEGVFEIRTKVDEDTDTVFAERTKKLTFIETAWGEILAANREGVEHGKGDYIVYACKNGKPDKHDRWVVNGVVFKNTYERI